MKKEIKYILSSSSLRLQPNLMIQFKWYITR